MAFELFHNPQELKPYLIYFKADKPYTRNCGTEGRYSYRAAFKTKLAAFTWAAREKLRLKDMTDGS